MRRALLCACSEYRDPAFTPLKYPLNDIEEIRHLLEEQDLCGFEDVEVLANPGRGEAHEAVEHLTADSGQDDLVLFYFSGHGKLAQDGSVSLVLSDTKENRLHSTGLIGDQLRALFNASRARQRVIILDCCYSGAVGEEGFKRASGDAVEAMAQQIKGTFILTASSKFQPAMECNEAKGSAFTSCLIEGVRSGSAAEKDTGCVTLSKLGEFLAREVPLRSNQQPKFWDFGGVGGTVIARVPSRFDAAWTEQTLKQLRQMMAREQIDDALFVEVQRVLRSPAGSKSQNQLGLVDDLAQRRLKPIPFLRKWQAFEQAEVDETEEEKLEREKLELEKLGWEELERDRLERDKLEREKLEWEKLQQEKIEREKLERERHERASPPPIEKPAPPIVEETSFVSQPAVDHPLDRKRYQVPPTEPEIENEDLKETVDKSGPPPPSLQARVLEFILIAASLVFGPGLLTINGFALDDDPTFVIIGAFLLILVWIRLWVRIRSGIGKLLLAGAILFFSYVGANLATNDIYLFFQFLGALLLAFTVFLAAAVLHLRNSQGPGI